MNQELPPLPDSFTDRKTSLTVFGILTIGSGLLCALLAAVVIAGQSISARAGNAPAGMVVMPVLLYGGLAVLLVWLGVGSIMARRWARALLLILSAATLAFGLMMVGMLALIWDKLFPVIQSSSAGASPLPDSAKWAVLGATCTGLALFFIIPPAIGTFFYSRKSVKATCEAHDPQEGWTDRCPLPVLAASLFLVFGALCMVGTAFGAHGIIPFFGIFLAGVPGAALYGVLSLLWLYVAWGLYRRDSRAWWIALVTMVIFPVSALITYHFHSPLEFYRLAGYTGAQLAQLEQNPMVNGDNMGLLTLASSLPWLIYLLIIKRWVPKAP